MSGSGVWKLWRITLALALLAGAGSHAANASGGDSAASDTVTVSYLKVYEQFMNLQIDESRTATVHDFAFRRDVGRFFLEKGTLLFCRPVEGRVCALYFEGKGRFQFTPPTRVERRQLQRFYQTDSLSEKFRTLFIIFADSTYEEFSARLNLQEGKAPRGAAQQVEYALRYLSNKKTKQFDYAVMKTFLDGERNGLFYAQFSYEKTRPLFFDINPLEDEEVRFMRRLKGPSYLYVPEIINQFHRREEYAASPFPPPQDRSSLSIENYRINSRLEGNSLKFSADTRFTFTGRSERQNWLYFTLYSELQVDSLFWEEDSLPARRKAVFLKEKDSPLLWVKCDTPLLSGQRRSLRLFYHGKLIERQKDWFYIKSPRGWYPKESFTAKAQFELQFTYPEKFELASIGRPDTLAHKDNTVTARWATDGPVRNVSFNIGFFKEFQIPGSDSIPPITVMMAETGHQEIARQWGQLGIGSGSNMERQVGEDIAGSIDFFQKKLGWLPTGHFYATEIPFLHGEAFPGMIHLSWITFQMTNEKGDDQVFRAHEVAHQWWGIGVDNRSYHDQWLSEGFAEFSGWWYFLHRLRREKGDEKKFYKMIEEWRKRIAGNRKYFLGSGRQAAPIWLGYRTLSSETQGDFNLIIYKKGAWVLQMLRAMLLDLETMSDDRFAALIGGFYRKYAGSAASTEDFIAFAEKFTGEDLTWFFEQWVYGADIPEYHFEEEITETADHRFQADCRVRQSGVADNFRMPVIVGVDFGNEEILARRVLISGPETRFRLGPFERKPNRIIFNHLESVLCE